MLWLCEVVGCQEYHVFRRRSVDIAWYEQIQFVFCFVKKRNPSTSSVLTMQHTKYSNELARARVIVCGTITVPVDRLPHFASRTHMTCGWMTIAWAVLPYEACTKVSCGLRVLKFGGPSEKAMAYNGPLNRRVSSPYTSQRNETRLTAQKITNPPAHLCSFLLLLLVSLILFYFYSEFNLYFYWSWDTI